MDERERERRIRRNGGSVINGERGVGKERKDGRKEGREEVKGRGRDSSAVALGTHTHTDTDLRAVSGNRE